MKTLTLRIGAALAGVAAAFFGGAAVTHAQNRPPTVPRPFAVKLGLRFPNDNTIKDVFGETWFSGGVSYDFAQSNTANPVVYQLYADYTQRRTGPSGQAANYAASGDVTGRLFGIGPAAKFLLAPLSARAQPYVGLGAGYYRATVPVTVVYAVAGGSAASKAIQYSGSGFGVETRSTGALGAKVFAGYQIKEGFIAEVDFTYVRPIDYLKTGGLGARLGYRF